MTAKPLLEVKNLSKSFSISKDFWGKTNSSLRAVHNISLEVAEGECLTIVGESGCGKSTLARMILRLVEADGGEVIYDGKDLLQLKEAELRQLRPNLQMVFQNPYSSLDPRYSIRDSIAEPLYVHWNYALQHLPKTKPLSKIEFIANRVTELLSLVELDASILDKYPHQCSGGQNQRACIARALALNPKLVVADEAVSALDVSTQWHILELIKKLQREQNISFLFIAHNLGVVKYVADRVAVMYLGEIVELASKDDLFANPLHPYTRALLNAAPVADPRQRDRKRILLSGEIPSATEIPSGCTFHSRCPIAEPQCSQKIPKLELKVENHKASCLLIKK